MLHRSTNTRSSSTSIKVRVVLVERRRLMYDLVWVELSITSNCGREGGIRCLLEVCCIPRERDTRGTHTTHNMHEKRLTTDNTKKK